MTDQFTVSATEPALARPSGAWKDEEPPRPSRLDVLGLEKLYGERRALGGVTFSLGNGVTALLGPNGAGKSTLMECVAGIATWDHGRILIDGADMTRDPRAARRCIGFMPERISFPGEMRVQAYLDFVASVKGIRRGDRGEAVAMALSRTGLEEVRTRIVGNLSKGYRQRVGLAQALTGDPPVVVLDEPNAGLDPLNVLDIREVLSDYGRDRAVLLSTHILPEAQALCERLVVLGGGLIVYDGPSTGMPSIDGWRRARIRLARGRPDQVEAAVGAVRGRAARMHVAGEACDAVVEVRSEDDLADVARHLVLEGCSLVGIEPTADMLEQAFRKVVHDDTEGKA